VNGQLLADDDGLHGMIERCSTLILSASTHVLYIAGFQAGGGVGMELRYSGPDTGGSKAFVLPGVIQSPVSLHENKREPLLSSISSEPLLQVGRSALLNSISALERQLQDQSKEVKNLKNRLDGDEHKGDASVTDGKEEVMVLFTCFPFHLVSNSYPFLQILRSIPYTLQCHVSISCSVAVPRSVSCFCFPLLC